MSEFKKTLKSAIRRQDSKALHQVVDNLMKNSQNLPIYELFIFICTDILKLTCQDLLTRNPIAPKKYQQILWLKEELKQSPFSLSVMMVIAYISSYTGDLDNASKLYRTALINYVNLLRTKDVNIQNAALWGWFINYANFTEPCNSDIEPFPFPKLAIPENLKTSKIVVTAYGNAAYIMRFAERFVKNIHTHIGEGISILLVVGDADDDCENYCKQLQQTYPQLHFAFDTIPDKFKDAKFLPTYCVLRRFTYIEDIFEEIGDHQLIALDLDLFINQDFKVIVEKTKDTPFGFYSTSDTVFSIENAIGGGYIIFNNSPIAQRIRYHVNAYLRKKFQTVGIAWVMDQYAFLHAVQAANLTKEELALCYNISDACDNIDKFHSGTSKQEELLYDQERSAKEKDTRFLIPVSPSNITFDKTTLCPIIYP